MTITKPLVTLDEVRALLPVRSGNTTQDAKLSTYIQVATSQLETLTRRRFTEQTHVQFFRSVDTRRAHYDFAGVQNDLGYYYSAVPSRYVLAGMPVDTNEPFEVAFDQYRVFGSDTIIDAADYVLDAENGVLTTRFGMTEETASLRVTYTSGYAVDGTTDTLTTSAPEDLKMACILQVLSLFNRSTPDNIGYETDRGNKGGSRKFAVQSGLAPEAAALAARFRQPLVGLS